MWTSREKFAFLWLAVLTCLYGFDKFGTMYVRTVSAKNIEVSDFRGDTAIRLSAHGASDGVPKSWPLIEMKGEEDSSVLIGIDHGDPPVLRLANFGDMEYAQMRPDWINFAATKTPLGGGNRYFIPRWAMWAERNTDVSLEIEGKRSVLAEKSAAN